MTSEVVPDCASAIVQSAAVKRDLMHRQSVDISKELVDDAAAMKQVLTIIAGVQRAGAAVS